MTGQGGEDHSTGAANPTLDSDRTSDTVYLAGATLHTTLWADQYGFAAVHLEHSVGANFHAHCAAIT